MTQGAASTFFRPSWRGRDRWQPSCCEDSTLVEGGPSLLLKAWQGFWGLVSLPDCPGPGRVPNPPPRGTVSSTGTGGTGPGDRRVGPAGSEDGGRAQTTGSRLICQVCFPWTLAPAHPRLGWVCASVPSWHPVTPSQPFPTALALSLRPCGPWRAWRTELAFHTLLLGESELRPGRDASVYTYLTFPSEARM